MRLTAIHSGTGKLLMTNDGSMDEKSFMRTLASVFPSVRPDQVLMVRDGLADGAEAPRRGKGVVWKGSFWDLGGYANMNREIVLRLAKLGFSVRIEILATGMQVDGATLATLKALEASKLRDEQSAPMVVGFTPMAIQRRNRKVAFFTMMETQRLHHEFVDRCNQHASEVWVPCQFYQRVFKESGVLRPVRVIPLGVNEELYAPGRPEPILPYEEMPSGARVQGLPKDKFKFMSLFGWSYRKGADVLCRSFIREFSASDGVGLVIYSRYMGSSAGPHKDFVQNEIRGWYAQENKGDPPPIYYCGECIPIADLPGCYCACDAFVFCSRGEGFGLPVIEAGACGLPVVSSFNTAMTEYLDDAVSLLVRPAGYAPANEKLTWISEYYRNQEFAVLGEEQVAEFGKHMRRVLEDPSGASARAGRFRERVLGNYTWDHCAKRVALALESLG